jgi:hypothetical protein
MGRTPFQGASLDVTSPRAKARLKPLGYSVRPLRGHRKMFKLPGRYLATPLQRLKDLPRQFLASWVFLRLRRVTRPESPARIDSHLMAMIKVTDRPRCKSKTIWNKPGNVCHGSDGIGRGGCCLWLNLDKGVEWLKATNADGPLGDRTLPLLHRVPATD